MGNGENRGKWLPTLTKSNDPLARPSRRADFLGYERYYESEAELQRIAKETEIRNFHRNQKLIDLNETPPSLCEKIWEEYQKEPQGKRRDLLNFFVEKRLNNLIETIGDF